MNEAKKIIHPPENTFQNYESFLVKQHGCIVASFTCWILDLTCPDIFLVQIHAARTNLQWVAIFEMFQNNSTYLTSDIPRLHTHHLQAGFESSETALHSKCFSQFHLTSPGESSHGKIGMKGNFSTMHEIRCQWQRPMSWPFPSVKASKSFTNSNFHRSWSRFT